VLFIRERVRLSDSKSKI